MDRVADIVHLGGESRLGVVQTAIVEERPDLRAEEIEQQGGLEGADVLVQFVVEEALDLADDGLGLGLGEGDIA